MQDKHLTVLSAFSGLGGLDLGLEKCGFKSLGCIELNEAARQTLKENRPTWRQIEPPDIGKAARILTPRTLGIRKKSLGLLAGGPPCQSFSKAAQWSKTGRQGLRDARAKCLNGFFKLVEAFLPRTILIENVQGFVTGPTSAISRVEQRLRAINRAEGVGYRLQHWIVNAADYGVPQRRTRAILFAERDGMQLTLPAAPHFESPITAWDALSNLPAENVAELGEPKGWLRLLPSIPEGHNYLWHTSRGGGLGLFGYRTRFWSFLLKLAKNQPAWTISAQPGPSTGPFHWDNRPLTVRELLRLQTFPHDWVVCGSTREQVRQIGNATPPLLAEAFGRAIREQIFRLEVSGTLRLAVPRTKVRPPMEAALVSVPKEFRKLVGIWPDHPGAGMGPSPVSTARATNGETTRQGAKAKRREKSVV